MEPEGLQAPARWPIFQSGLGCDCRSPLRVTLLGAKTHLSMLCPLCCAYISDTVVGKQSLLELGREPKAHGTQFQNLDMGTDHMALVSLVQRVSAATDSNLAGGDCALHRTCYLRQPVLLGFQDV